MKPEFQQYELIDNYLDGKLTGSELQNFQSRMANDASFRTDIEGQQVANAFIMDSGLVELRQKMEGFRPAKKSVPRSLQLYIVAAGVTFLAGFMFWFTSADRDVLTESSAVTEMIPVSPQVIDNDRDDTSIKLTKQLYIVEKETQEIVTVSDVPNNFEEEAIKIQLVTSSALSSTEATDLNINIVPKVEAELVDASVDDINEVIASSEGGNFENVVPLVHCRPTSIFPKVEFDEFYKYVDVEIKAFGSLEGPYRYFVNGKEVEDFKNLEPVNAELKLIDVNGCEGSTKLEIHIVDE